MLERSRSVVGEIARKRRFERRDARLRNFMYGAMVEKATMLALFAAAFASGSRHLAAPEPQHAGAASALILELTPLDDASDHADTVTYDGVVYAARRLSRRQLQEEGHYLHPGSAAFYQCIIIITGLVSMAGLMAGCTMGVLSLDPVRLKLLRLQGSDEEKRWAKAVLPVLASHHHLLVALLLCNAAANEALPIFLAELVNERDSIIISVCCVLVFGEIIPSALMTGPRQLQLAAAVSPLIKLLLIVTAPISWPMAKGLDVCMGNRHEHSTDAVAPFPQAPARQRAESRRRAWHKYRLRGIPKYSSLLSPSLSSIERGAGAMAGASDEPLVPATSSDQPEPSELPEPPRESRPREPSAPWWRRSAEWSPRGAGTGI